MRRGETTRYPQRSSCSTRRPRRPRTVGADQTLIVPDTANTARLWLHASDDLAGLTDRVRTASW
ncbi:hypothetical protein GCM10020000_08760 [Streptomyces olivoverticillatus]